MATKLVDIPQIHEFWFGNNPSPDLKALSVRWFQGGAELDTDIRETFGPTIEAAADGTLHHWQDTPKGTIALIVLLDQFPLNAYRKTAKAFAFEQTAVDICLKGIEQGFDQQLSIPERLFFYLPLVHSENIEHQNQAVTLFEQLVNSTSESDPERTFAEYSLKSAIEHREQIKRFGRYPFRNEVLKRQSTEEELAWLNDNPDRYGQ